MYVSKPAAAPYTVLRMMFCPPQRLCQSGKTSSSGAQDPRSQVRDILSASARLRDIDSKSRSGLRGSWGNPIKQDVACGDDASVLSKSYARCLGNSYSWFQGAS